MNYLAYLPLAGLLVLLSLVPMFLRRVVEPNEVHIVQRKRSTTSHGRGQPNGNAYYEWPHWLPLIGVQTIKLPLSNFSISLDAYPAYDVGRLPFELDVIAFFRIDNPAQAATRISSINELVAQLKSIVQGAVRTVLAKEDIEQIMGERAKFGEAFTNEVQEHLLEWGVCTVKSVELMDIRDADEHRTISNIMAKKSSLIEMQSRTEVANNRKTASIAETQAQRDADLEIQQAQEAVGRRTAEKDMNIGTADERSKQAIATEAATTAAKDMYVQQVKDVRAAEIAKAVQVVAAEQQKETDVIKAEGEKQQTILRAEGELTAQQRNAEGTLAVGTAEADVLKLKELAPVQAQITLAKEIGENEGYQRYLIDIRRVEMIEHVGTEQAKALTAADVRVIATAGSPGDGINKVGELFSARGGQDLGALLEGLANTPMGESVLKRLGIGRPNGDATAGAAQ